MVRLEITPSFLGNASTLNFWTPVKILRSMKAIWTLLNNPKPTDGQIALRVCTSAPLRIPQKYSMKQFLPSCITHRWEGVCVCEVAKKQYIWYNFVLAALCSCDGNWIKFGCSQLCELQGCTRLSMPSHPGWILQQNMMLGASTSSILSQTSCISCRPMEFTFLIILELLIQQRSPRPAPDKEAQRRIEPNLWIHT